VAYKRVRAGTEGSAGIVIGSTAAEVTAVFANSPGALQLLPSQHYGSGWLKLGSGQGPHFKELASLPEPQGDPYEQIYKQRGPWWALVREELINPAKSRNHRGWKDYLDNITLAESFHKDLGSQYHPNTWCFYGDGLKEGSGLSWGTVRWQAWQQWSEDGVEAHTGLPLPNAHAGPLGKEEAMALRVETDTGIGQVGARSAQRRVDLSISAADSPGDGTVPERSGAAPAKADLKAVYHLNLDSSLGTSIGHEGAYRHEQAQQLTLHAVLSMSSQIPLLQL
jgi:hypothetical protein